MPNRGDLGFTLLEVVIALAIFSVALIALAQVVLGAGEASAAAARTTVASQLATEKLEQLRGLAWGYDEAGSPVQDLQSDTSGECVIETGGHGLGLSGVDTLGQDVPGFVDYHDVSGRWLGQGGAAPAGTVMVRRWSVAALADGPGETLVLQVRVLRAPGGAEEGWELARAATLKTRRPR
jgi:prepilin-type N-terminal cleavage/methylation domain-containing protein